MLRGESKCCNCKRQVSVTRDSVVERLAWLFIVRRKGGRPSFQMERWCPVLDTLIYCESFLSLGARDVLKPRAPSRILFVPVTGLSANGLGVLFSLACSSVLGMIVSGFGGGLQSSFLTLQVVLSTLLLPVCAKRSGYRMAIGIATIAILSACLILVFFQASTGLISPEGVATIAWALIQVAIVRFAYSADREQNTRH